MYQDIVEDSKKKIVAANENNVTEPRLKMLDILDC